VGKTANGVPRKVGKENRQMANLTSKELSALEDQIKSEQVLVKKYRAMACLCSDMTTKTSFDSYADKHQQHCDTLMGFLQ
jgi:hypothetical protein